jgi:tetratricopeptide (TPR) repeat protein
MKRPTPSPDNVRELIALCLQLREERGPRAVDEVLRRHPESSERVRARLDLLGRLGMVNEGPEEAPPERIGNYRIIEVLGRGGMGVVYGAEQDRPRRRVALKVLRTWPGEQGQLRFQLEGELLGRLQHPGIASIHEVGTATVGGMTVPFFAMELVRGTSLDRYVNEQAPTVRARLELLAQIADAVHHAHQKGVVHRDLKPANVMMDNRGRPKVLDFGVARAMDPDLKLERLRTEVGQLVGTLAYMSPEQAAGNPDEIDSRSDVYSLGVIGYELLAGRLPLEVLDGSVLEALEMIRDEEPPLLGTLDRSLRGDVETILALALSKEKARRYDSAHELAADLRRHLADEPIAARPATAAYQLVKFARRHRTVVGGAAAVVLALALGLAGTFHGLVRASSERDDAEGRFRQASAVLDFQGRMFSEADPRREGVQVEDLLDRALLLMSEEDEDTVKGASIRLMLGKSLRGIGAFEKARPLIAAAAQTFDERLGSEDLQTLSARTELASLLGPSMGHWEEAARALRGVEATASRVHGEANAVTLRAQLVRAGLHYERGQYREAVDLAQTVESAAGPDSLEWISAQEWLAKSLASIGEVQRALDISRARLDWLLAALGREHPRTWSAMDTHGVMLQNHGRMNEGGILVRELLELHTEFLGPRHPSTLDSKTKTSLDHYHRGEYARAMELLQEVLEVCDQDLPAGHPSRQFALGRLVTIYLAQGRAAEAEPIGWELFERSSETLGPEHPSTLRFMKVLATILRRLQRADQAEEMLREALAIERRTLGDRHTDTLSTVFNLGHHCTTEGRLEEGESLLREAVDVGREALGPNDANMMPFLLGLAQNLMLQQRFPEAEEILLESREWGRQAGPPESLGNRKLRELFERLDADWDRPENGETPAASPEES